MVILLGKSACRFHGRRKNFRRDPHAWPPGKGGTAVSGPSRATGKECLIAGSRSRARGSGRGDESWLAGWRSGPPDPEIAKAVSVSDGSFLRKRQNGRAKPQPRRLSLGVLVGQVAIDLANEDSAVFVANPARNCHKVDAAHHGVADEMVPQVMESDPLQIVRQHVLLGLQVSAPAAGAGCKRLFAGDDMLATAADVAGHRPRQQQRFAEGL